MIWVYSLEMVYPKTVLLYDKEDWFMDFVKAV